MTAKMVISLPEMTYRRPSARWCTCAGRIAQGSSVNTVWEILRPFSAGHCPTMRFWLVPPLLPCEAG